MLKIKHITPPYCLYKIGMLALVCSVMLCSCQKEDVGTMTTLNLFSEESSMGDSKLAVNGFSMKWCDLDRVRINNNGVFNVTVNENGATVNSQYSTVPFSTPLRAVSPDISNLSHNITSDQHEVRLPSTYNYATTTLGGNEVQHLATPMAAYAAHGNNLYFKYLTGALTVKLKNTTAKTIYIEDITISSNNYQLSGNRTIDFTDLENIQPQRSDYESERKITMKCNRKAVAAGSTLPVQIPVLPVGADNCFTVEVRYITEFDGTIASGSYTYQLKNYYTFSKTQPARTSGSGNSLGRGELGYVTVELKEESSSTYQRDFFFKDADGYYLISTPMELKWLSTLSNTGSHFTSGQKVKLTNDIDMTGQSYFIPIKKVIEFDGNSKNISNLDLWSVSTNCSGLLKDESTSSSGYTGITVNNLNMIHCTLKIQSSTAFAGFIVGYANQDATISNCHVDNSTVHFVTSGTPSVIILDIGGICGRVSGKATLTDCRAFDLLFTTPTSNYVSSYSTLNCGGLIGYTNRDLFKSCYVNITNSNNVIKNTNADGVIRFGGFEGYHSSSDENFIFHNSAYNDSRVIIQNLTVNGSNQVYAGALCGSMISSRSINLANTYQSSITTTGSITVNAPTEYIGSAANKYVCGSGNSYIFDNSSPYNTATATLELTIN